MTALLGAAGRAFLKDFMAALVVLGAGIWLAPNLGAALLIAIAAIIGATRAGLKAITVLVPQFSLEHWAAGRGGLLARYAYVLDAALQAFIAGLLALGVGFADWFLNGDPTLDGAKLFVTSGLVAIGSAVITAIQGALTPGTHPVPSSGFSPPATNSTPPLAILLIVASLMLLAVSAATVMKPHHWNPEAKKSPPHWFQPQAAKSPPHWFKPHHW